MNWKLQSSRASRAPTVQPQQERRHTFSRVPSRLSWMAPLGPHHPCVSLGCLLARVSGFFSVEGPCPKAKGVLAEPGTPRDPKSDVFVTKWVAIQPFGTFYARLDAEFQPGARQIGPTPSISTFFSTHFRPKNLEKSKF